MARIQNGGRRPLRTKSVLGQAGRPATPKFDALRGLKGKPDKTIIDVLVARRKAVEDAIRIFRQRK